MKQYLCLLAFLLSSISRSSQQPIPVKTFRNHFARCLNNAKIGGCPKCQLLFWEKLHNLFQQFNSYFHEQSSYEQLIKESNLVHRSGMDFRAIMYRATCLIPHRDTVEENCPIMTVNHHCHSKIDLKIASGAQDLCALFLLGLWYFEHHKEEHAEIVWNLVGKKYPKSYLQIGRMYGNWLSPTVTNAEKACSYFEMAGEAGYILGYLESALLQRRQYMPTKKSWQIPNNQEKIYAKKLLLQYDKVIEQQKKDDQNTFPAVYEEKADFIHKYPQLFNDNFFQEAHLEAITIAKSPKAAYEYAQWLEKKGFNTNALHYFKIAIAYADSSEKFIRKQACNAAVTLYQKSGLAEKGAALYEQCGRYKKAAEIYAQYAQFKKTAELYVKASENYLARGNLEKYLPLYEQAAEYYLRCGETEKAAEIYAKYKKPEKTLDALLGN